MAARQMNGYEADFGDTQRRPLASISISAISYASMCLTMRLSDPRSLEPIVSGRTAYANSPGDASHERTLIQIGPPQELRTRLNRETCRRP